MAVTATRRVTDHDQAILQLAEADHSNLAIVSTRILDFECDSRKHFDGIFEVESTILKRLRTLSRIIGDAHRRYCNYKYLLLQLSLDVLCLLKYFSSNQGRLPEESKMPTDTPPQDDLSFLRTLAESGLDAPLMAGPYLIAGGSWFAAASLVQWPLLRDLAGLSADQAVAAWLISALGFAIHLTILIRRDRDKVETTSNRAVNAVWSGIGFGIFAFWVGVAMMAYRGSEAFVLNTISLQVLSVYGIGWLVAAAITREGWMTFTAIAAFGTVPVLGLFVGTGHEYLIYAIALVLTAVIPGVRLLRKAQSA